MFVKVTPRNNKISPTQLLIEKFGEQEQIKDYMDAIFTNASCTSVMGIAGLPIKAPAMQSLLENEEVVAFFTAYCKDQSLLIKKEDEKISLIGEDGQVIDIPNEMQMSINGILEDIGQWAGYLTAEGEHVIDLLKPAPGPHFYVNLLLGNRLGFNHSLQTTPKSVVDRLGRGSFRSHAATQVLATKFDVRQEENGFPTNRQFYLFEDNKQIFYSAHPKDKNVVKAMCTHSQNKTVISYKTDCGLEITRTIFLLPHQEGFPLATEVQRIEVKNKTSKIRELRISYTGMFGTGAPPAIFEDVTYTNVIMQSSIITNEEGDLLALSPDYYPDYAKNDSRFVSLLVREGEKSRFADSFCTDYNDFVGNGTLEYPSHANFLNNKLNRKGPGFFALGAPLHIESKSEIVIDTFTGLSSDKDHAEYNDETMIHEVEKMITYYSEKEAVEDTLKKVIGFQEEYCSYFKFETGDQLFDAYFNKNLSFQVLYQTFMSRSFCQTQKGYREIGFREIQDAFASMYYFISMNNQEFIKNLLFEWSANVYKMGYANHNFYWVGKQPGMYSDDSLWLIQAYYRYIIYTKDTAILNEEVVVADGTGEKRTIRDTLRAIIQYSSAISVGKHGLPLIDHADWNDCLKIDTDYIDGAAKEKLYYKQLEETKGTYGDPFESNYSESIMNAFLLKLAIDEVEVMSKMDKDEALSGEMNALSKTITNRIQEHAWKENFFARVLLNRYADGSYTYLGAKGDTLSNDPNIDGTYFLNSFSWAVLAEVATQEQIKIMIDTIKKYVLTPYGLRVLTPAALGKLAKDTAVGNYFFGDRENGAVFKHASMMATSALVKAAKEVEDSTLAEEMASMAYAMVDLVLPYKNLENPYQLGGNPRICTQYINTDTGENIGPLLSGTSTWLNLALISLAGIEYVEEGISFNPILRQGDEHMAYTLKGSKCTYKVNIIKPVGFVRLKDSSYTLSVDDEVITNNIIPYFEDEKEHKVSLTF